MKHITLFALIIISMNFAAATTVECESKLVFEVLKGSKRKVLLKELSPELSAHLVAVDGSSTDDILTASAKDISVKSTKVSNWTGNWGFELTIPNALFENKVRPNETFRVKYHFIYNDIAEEDLKQTLDCTVVH